MLMRFDFFPLDSETKKSILGMIFSDHEDENDPDGPFAFRRRRNCNYFAVSMLSILLEQAYGQLLGLNRMPKIQETQNLIFGFNFTAYSQSPWKLALV